MDGRAYGPIRFRQLSATTSLKLTVGLAVEWMPFIMNVIVCPIFITLPTSFELLSFLRFSVGSSPTFSFSSEASPYAIGMKEQARVYVIKRMKKKKAMPIRDPKSEKRATKKMRWILSFNEPLLYLIAGFIVGKSTEFFCHLITLLLEARWLTSIKCKEGTKRLRGLKQRCVN